MAVHNDPKNLNNNDNATGAQVNARGVETPLGQNTLDENLRAFSETQDVDNADQEAHDYIPPQPTGYTDLGTYLRRSIDVRKTDERARQLIEVFKTEILESHQQRLVVNLHLMEVDNNRAELPFPAVVAYHEVYGPNGEVDTVAYGTLLIEEDIDLGYNEQRLGNATLAVPRTSFEEYDDTYDATIRDMLKRHYIHKHGIEPHLLFSGVAVLTHEVQLENTEDVLAVLAGLGDMCTSAVLDDTLDPSADVNANLRDAILTQGYNLQSSLQYNPAPIVGADGLVTHADLIISTKAVRRRQTQNTQNYQQRGMYSREVVDVGIMMDLVHVGQQQNPMSGFRDQFMRAQPNQRTPSFLANAIITNISNKQTITTLSTCLLAVSSALIIQADEVYPETLKPQRSNSGKEELGNIGDIGFVIPNDQGELGYIDVHAAEFTQNHNAELYALIFENIYPNVVLSMDIPETILGSRSIKVLAKAAEPHTLGSREALVRIEAVLDQLTSGLFTGKYWKGGPIASPNPLLVPMGYFFDKNNVKRDLREINFLAVADFAGNTDRMNILADWQDSMEMEDRVRGAAIRISIINEMLGRDRVFVKGYAQRYLLEGNFIQACGMATVEAGIAPTFNNLAQGERRRLTASLDHYSQYMLDRSGGNQYASSTRYNMGSPGRMFNRHNNYR